MYQKILIATDGSTLSKKAVTSGLELAALTGASVVALKVVPRYPVSYFEGGVALSLNNVAGVESSGPTPPWQSSTRSKRQPRRKASGPKP